MGSPDFAVPALHALAAAGHEIAAVYTQPPRPAHRGQALTKCAVQQAAEALALPVRTPARLKRDAAEHEAFAALRLDAAIVAAYGLILPKPMLDAPRLGCINIHASLLPRWRGAAPIQAAILAGDTETGITIMRMEEGLDTGPMLLCRSIPIGPRTTTPELHDALATLGAELIVETLADLPRAVPQSPEAATYAAKLTRDDGKLDFSNSAETIDRQIRALTPWPGTTAQFAGDLLKILHSEPAQAEGPQGAVLDARFTVACGAGALRLLRVQRPGRPAASGDAFLRGVPGWQGMRVT
jgi:methionyl-tRNA formyltransferase